MRIALFQGKSLVSQVIRWITRSRYSHAAFVFDENANGAANAILNTGRSLRALKFYNVGAIVEAWKGGVQNSLGISTLHTPGTIVDLFELIHPLTPAQEEQLVSFCADIIGWPYGFLNVLRFITRHPGRDDGSYFCSEAVFEGFRRAGCTLLANKADWEVPPDWLQMPTILRKWGTMVTK